MREPLGLILAGGLGTRMGGVLKADLMLGRHFNSFVAPLTAGEKNGLEGTPNVYNASLVHRDGLYMVDATIGFHYNDAAGVDQVGHGTIRSFGPTDVTPTWEGGPATTYTAAFIRAGQ